MPWYVVTWITAIHYFISHKKASTVRLQSVQNILCHTVCRLNKFSHVTPFLHKLRWLPIHYCILFKYSLVTYKAIKFSQPQYLYSLLKWNNLTQGNRPSVSSSKPNKSSGFCSFTVAVPTEWKKLLQAIRTFESIWI